MVKLAIVVPAGRKESTHGDSWVIQKPPLTLETSRLMTEALLLPSDNSKWDEGGTVSVSTKSRLLQGTSRPMGDTEITGIGDFGAQGVKVTKLLGK